MSVRIIQIDLIFMILHRQIYYRLDDIIQVSYQNLYQKFFDVRCSHLFKACLLEDFLVSGFQDIKKYRTIIIFHL